MSELKKSFLRWAWPNVLLLEVQEQELWISILWANCTYLSKIIRSNLVTVLAVLPFLPYSWYWRFKRGISTVAAHITSVVLGSIIEWIVLGHSVLGCCNTEKLRDGVLIPCLIWLLASTHINSLISPMTVNQPRSNIFTDGGSIFYAFSPISLIFQLLSLSFYELESEFMWALIPCF